MHLWTIIKIVEVSRHKPYKKESNEANKCFHMKCIFEILLFKTLPILAEKICDGTHSARGIPADAA